MRQNKSSATVASFKERDAWMRSLAASDGLSVFSKLVGIRLSLHLNCETGRCNPAYGTLARELGLRQKRSVIAAVAALEQGGWLLVKRSRGGAYTNSNSYKLNQPERATGDRGSTPTGEPEDTPGVINR